MVLYPSFCIIGQSSSQNGKHVNHEGGYDCMKEDIQHMEANRVQTSHQEVVQPTAAREEFSLLSLIDVWTHARLSMFA